MAEEKVEDVIKQTAKAIPKVKEEVKAKAKARAKEKVKVKLKAVQVRGAVIIPGELMRPAISNTLLLQVALGARLVHFDMIYLKPRLKHKTQPLRVPELPLRVETVRPVKVAKRGKAKETKELLVRMQPLLPLLLPKPRLRLELLRMHLQLLNPKLLT